MQMTSFIKSCLLGSCTRVEWHGIKRVCLVGLERMLLWSRYIDERQALSFLVNDKRGNLIPVLCIGCARQLAVKKSVSDYGCTRNLRHMQHRHCLTFLMYLLDSRCKLYNVRPQRTFRQYLMSSLLIFLLMASVISWLLACWNFGFNLSLVECLGARMISIDNDERYMPKWERYN